MKIAVLNGSPKGDVSATMQYVHYMQKKFPRHELKILNVAQRIGKIEKDDGAFEEIIDEVRSSDGVLWAFPLYFLLVSAQYKRFIELLWERGAADFLEKKYAAILATSIHFFDHTAINYMNAVCDDLKMKYLGSYSADTYDLLKEEERKRFLLFAGGFFDSIENKVPTSKSYRPVTRRKFEYIPGPAAKSIDAGGKKVLILTDIRDQQTNLAGMIERFRGSFSQEIETINLHDLDIKGGCQGCIQCGYDNQCVYQGKDDYIDFFDSKVKTADVLIWAGTIRDRYLSSRWKIFFDRSFYNNHAPVLMDKQVAFILSGPLSQIPNLRQVLEGYLDNQRANRVGFVTDEFGSSTEIDALLQHLAERSLRFAETGYVRPPTFLAVAGKLLFRDEVWGRLRPVFQADHRVYKELGIYDFPQKRIKRRVTNGLMTIMLKSPRFRKEFTKRIKKGMIHPLQKVLED